MSARNKHQSRYNGVGVDPFFVLFFSSSGRQFILDVVASVFQLYLCVLLAFNQMNSVTRIEMLMTCLCSEPGRVCWSPLISAAAIAALMDRTQCKPG